MKARIVLMIVVAVLVFSAGVHAANVNFDVDDGPWCVPDSWAGGVMPVAGDWAFLMDNTATLDCEVEIGVLNMGYNDDLTGVTRLNIVEGGHLTTTNNGGWDMIGGMNTGAAELNMTGASTFICQGYSIFNHHTGDMVTVNIGAEAFFEITADLYLWGTAAGLGDSVTNLEGTLRVGGNIVQGTGTYLINILPGGVFQVGSWVVWDMETAIEDGLVTGENLTVSMVEIDGKSYVQASSPGTSITGASPTDGAINVGVDVVLMWDAPGEIAEASYDVYFGEDPNFAGVAPESTGQAEMSFDPLGEADLDNNVTYYWRVDVLEPNDLGPGWTVYAGVERGFTTIAAIPLITSDPVEVVAAVGGSAEFSVTALNDDSYLWYYSDTAEGEGVAIDGATLGTLVLDDVGPADEGYYYCVVSNDAGDVASGRARLSTEKLLAHWTFDGESLDDAIGDLDGIAVGEPIFVDGVYGGAIELNGTSDAVYIANTSEPLSVFTVTAWVKYDELNPGEWFNGIMISDGWDEGDIHFQIGQDGWFGAAINGGVEFGDLVKTIEPGVWQHVTAVFDSLNGNTVMYHNGRVSAGPSLGDIVQVTLGQMHLGAWFNAAETDPGMERFLDGALDDVRVYNYALSELEAQSLYIDGAPDAIVCMEVLPYDLDGDCDTDLGDLAIVASEWLRCSRVGDCVFELP